MTRLPSLASDNYAGMHPLVLQALANANHDSAVAYGQDDWTQQADALFREQFGPETQPFYVFNGTAANVLSIQSVNRPHQAVLCTDCAHIHMDECGAPEQQTGCKLLTVPNQAGKLTVDQLTPFLHQAGVEHSVQPGLISITQATELGTVYRPEEIRTIANFAHANGLLLHMDGARLANAAAFLNLPLKALTTDVGVDILSFGGTRNGLMLGEAVVFLHPGAHAPFKFLRKQGMQLASKMRFIAAQFVALFTNDLWLQNAQHANAMAQYLAHGLQGIPNVSIHYPVEANGVFVRIPRPWIAPLQQASRFYVWDEATCLVRWMTAFNTQPEAVDAFVTMIKTVAERSLSTVYPLST
jgi:threonine aldolase